MSAPALRALRGTRTHHELPAGTLVLIGGVPVRLESATPVSAPDLYWGLVERHLAKRRMS